MGYFLKNPKISGWRCVMPRRAKAHLAATLYRVKNPDAKGWRRYCRDSGTVNWNAPAQRKKPRQKNIERTSMMLVPVTVTQSNYPTPSTADSTTDTASGGTTKVIVGAGATDGIALITGDPAMPQLTAQLGGFGSSSPLTVDWRLTVTSERSERGIKDNYSVPQTDESDVVNVPINQPWNMNTYFVAPADFFGGNITLYFTIKNGTTAITPEQSVTFKIRGLNPLDATAKSYIQANEGAYSYAWAIAQHESRLGNTVYNQFNSGGSQAELPNFSGGYPNQDGWGMFQRDDTDGGIYVTTEQVYSWSTNTSVAFQELAQKSATATRIFGYFRNTYGSQPGWQEPPATYSFHGKTFSATDLATIVLYNHVTGCPPSSVISNHGHTITVTFPWTFSPSQGWQFFDNNLNYASQVVQEMNGESYSE